jgi:hypothetical protein
VCQGIAKIDQETIAQELSSVSFIALDDLRADFLICTDHVPIVFGVELAGECGGIDQVTEHDGELSTFSFRGVMVGWWRFGIRVCFLDDRLWWDLDSLSNWLRVRAAIAGPDKDALMVIHCQLLSVDEFVLQGFNALIAQVKLHLEGSIGHPSSLLQEVDNLVAYIVEIHYRLSSNASSKALASFKSAVSKPSVNHP